MKFAVDDPSPLMGEARRGCEFAVWSLCGVSPSPNQRYRSNFVHSHLGRGGFWSALSGFGFTNSILNNLQYTLEIIPNIRIPKAQYAKSLISKELITNFVVRIIQVLATICFYNNFVFKTNEIKNISAYRFLAAKFNTKIFSAQVFPKKVLFVGHTLSEFASNVGHRHNFHYGVLELRGKRSISLHSISQRRGSYES